jgi:hypothetical protein
MNFLDLLKDGKLLPSPKMMVAKGHIKRANIIGEQQAIELPPDHRFKRKIIINNIEITL